MKISKLFLLSIGCVLLLALVACSGGGGDKESQEHFSIFHNMELVKTDNGPQLEITLGVSHGRVYHLVKDNKAVSLPLEEIDKLTIEGVVIGYTTSNGGKTVSVLGSKVTIDGVATDDIILISAITKDGNKYFLNSDRFIFLGSVPVDVRNGLIYYGAAADDPNFNGSAEEPMHNVSMLNGDLQFKFAVVDGYIVELSKEVKDAKGNIIGVPATLKVEDVHRVFCNGDGAGWSLADSNPYSGLLNLPVTSLLVLAGDKVIIRIVDIQGNVYSINTEKTTGLPLTTDGRNMLAIPK